MFKLLVEIESTYDIGEYTSKSGENVIANIHTPDMERSNQDVRGMGAKKIKIADDMSVEDKKAFDQIQKNIKQFKQSLIDSGQGGIANQIPDNVANPPDFIFGFHAYTFKKEPNTIEDLFRTRGAMSALKGRNKEHYMYPEEITKVVNHAAERLATNIQQLLKHEHKKLVRSTNSSASLISNFAVTSSYFWLNKFTPGAVNFPGNTILAPLGSSAGLVGQFTSSLSTLTGTPVIEDVFKKSNNPVISNFVRVANTSPELRMGTEIYPVLLASGYASTEIDKLKDKTNNFLSSISMNPKTTVNTTNVTNAIERLSPERQQELSDKISSNVPEVEGKSPEQILNLYFRSLMRKIRVALTSDYNYYTDYIDEQFQNLMDIKLSGGKNSEAQKKKRIDAIQEIRAAKSILKQMPKPDVTMGGSDADMTMAGLKSLIANVRTYINSIDISKEDYDNDAKIKKVMADIKSARENVPIGDLQRLYKLAKGKLFKFSGARPKAGGDVGDAFSRFQLANLPKAKQLNGKHVVIIDDNISSGGTVRDAVISLYVNGITPLSIVVIAPHYLSNTAAKFNPDEEELVDGRPMTEPEWKERRKRKKAEVDRGDDEYRAEVIAELEKSVDISNDKAVRDLADLAISVTTGDSPFMSVLLAQKLFKGDFDFKKYIDFVVHLGMITSEYKDWYARYKDEITTVYSRAKRPLTPAEIETLKQRSVWRDKRQEIVGGARDSATALANAAAAAAAAKKQEVLSTKGRIDAYRTKLNAADTPENVKPAIRTFITYLRSVDKIETGNIFIRGLQDIKKDIEQTIRSGNIALANNKIDNLVALINSQKK